MSVPEKLTKEQFRFHYQCEWDTDEFLGWDEVWICIQQLYVSCIIRQNEQIADQQAEIDSLKADIGMLKMGFKPLDFDEQIANQQEEIEQLRQTETCNTCANFMRNGFSGNCDGWRHNADCIDHDHSQYMPVDRCEQKQFADQHTVIEQLKSALERAYRRLTEAEPTNAVEVLQIIKDALAAAEKLKNEPEKKE